MFNLLFVSVFFTLTTFITCVDITFTLDNRLEKPKIRRVVEDEFVATIWWRDTPYDYYYPSHYEIKADNVTSWEYQWGEVGANFDKSGVQTVETGQMQPLKEGVMYEVRVRAIGYGYKFSEWSEVTRFKSDSTRVNNIRTLATGFFDDFNHPSGGPDERKWNVATNQCARSEVAQMWNNVQLHNHWTMAQAPFYCDREQIMTVARSVFDISSGSGQVFFDLDGSTHGRHLWYLELISLPNDKSKIDVVGFVDAFPGGGNKAPAKNAARILLRENTISVITVDANGADHGECDRRLGPLASDVESVPNVRKPWIVTVEPTRIRVKILDREVIDCQLEHVTLGNRLQVGASMFIYNTPKSGHSSVTMHWDNFGFTGPRPTQETLNYREDYQTRSKSVSIAIPDTIESDVSSVQLRWIQWRDQSSGDKVEVNGQSFDVPAPLLAPDDFAVGGYLSASFVLDLPLSAVKSGSGTTNTIQFNVAGNVLKTHLEVTYPCKAGKTRQYTPPKNHATQGCSYGKSGFAFDLCQSPVPIEMDYSKIGDQKIGWNHDPTDIFTVASSKSVPLQGYFHGGNVAVTTGGIPSIDRIEVLVDCQLVETLKFSGAKIGATYIDTTIDTEGWSAGVHSVLLRAVTIQGAAVVGSVRSAFDSGLRERPIFVKVSGSNSPLPDDCPVLEDTSACNTQMVCHDAVALKSKSICDGFETVDVPASSVAPEATPNQSSPATVTPSSSTTSAGETTDNTGSRVPGTTATPSVGTTIDVSNLCELGTVGCACNETGECNSGLECFDKSAGNVCLDKLYKEIDCAPGTEACRCRDDGSCSSAQLFCDQVTNACLRPECPLGTFACRCAPNQSCQRNLYCDNVKGVDVCVKDEEIVTLSSASTLTTSFMFGVIVNLLLLACN